MKKLEEFENCNKEIVSNQDLKSELPQYMNTYMFVKGAAVAQHLSQTLLALSVASFLHEGQFRKDGSPYITHPLEVCSFLIYYGVIEDDVLAAALLHDVIENCEERMSMQKKQLSDYGINQDVIELVMLLSKKQGLDKDALAIYFQGIAKNYKASLVKLVDRLHNCSSLYVFSKERMEKYITETNEFVIPLASQCKINYPNYIQAFTLLEWNIMALNRSVKKMGDKIEE